MHYSSADFGKDLLAEMGRGYDPIRIAKWAFARLMDPEVKISSSSLRHTMMTVVAMEEGPEFEYSEAELRTLAEKLISQDVD